MKSGFDGFMDYMGYRHMIVEEKIEECVSAIRRGETSVSFDRGDLTDDEIQYLEKEVRRRAGRVSNSLG